MNQVTFDLVYDQQNRDILANHPNPINRAGKKCFSQNDEDGITIEILRRLGLSTGTYIEFGVGNGLENNTLILAALGWKGAWVGVESLAFNYKPNDKLLFLQEWINLKTLPTIMSTIANTSGILTPDVFSVDLDGNDIHLVKDMLDHGIMPKMWIVEYNAKFPPPVEFNIQYADNFMWVGDDYFGASLASYVKVFEQAEYMLVATNAYSGSNAFFVHKDYWPKFYDVPIDINVLYTPPRYQAYRAYAFPTSANTVQQILGI